MMVDHGNVGQILEIHKEALKHQHIYYAIDYHLLQIQSVQVNQNNARTCSPLVLKFEYSSANLNSYYFSLSLSFSIDNI